MQIRRTELFFRFLCYDEKKLPVAIELSKVVKTQTARLLSINSPI
jgi:hypothetical protein